MKVVYLCPFTGKCGGTRVIANHVSGLNSQGIDAEWWGLQPPPQWFGTPVPYRQFPHTDQIGQAMQATDAHYVATWWQTASWVVSNLRGSSRGHYLVQDLDQETYSHDHSGSSYKLPLNLIVESEWVERQLRERWNLPSTNVGIGVEAAFLPRVIDKDHDRIFTAYRPNAGPNDLKGWATAMAVIRRVRETNKMASLVTFGSHGSPRMPSCIPHIHVASPTDAKLAELYSQAGCYLMSSRHEGFGLPAAEAMRCKCPVVTTNAHGNMEFCKNGETAWIGHSAEELAAHVLKIREGEGVEPVVEAASQLIDSRYGWADVHRRLEGIFGPD